MTGPVIADFVESTHEYSHQKVKLYGTTGILEAEGMGPDSKWYGPGCAERGTIVHYACEYHSVNDLDWDSVPPEFQGYVWSWDRFLQATSPEFIVMPDGRKMIEVPLCDPGRRIAGKPDYGAVLAGNPHKAIIDIKTGQMQKKFKWQLASYGHLGQPGLPWRRIVVRLREDGRMPLVDEFPVEEFFADLYDFFAIARTVQAREENGYGNWLTRNVSQEERQWRRKQLED